MGDEVSLILLVGCQVPRRINLICRWFKVFLFSKLEFPIVYLCNKLLLIKLDIIHLIYWSSTSLQSCTFSWVKIFARFTFQDTIIGKGFRRSWSIVAANWPVNLGASTDWRLGLDRSWDQQQDYAEKDTIGENHRFHCVQMWFVYNRAERNPEAQVLKLKAEMELRSLQLRIQINCCDVRRINRWESQTPWNWTGIEVLYRKCVKIWVYLLLFEWVL